jgi:GNAT superfamily N-acetyltransferase
MGVKKDFHGKGIGKALLQAVERLCVEKDCDSLTVETLSPKHADKGYLQTYAFYTKEGFKPLFELYPYGPDYLMIYLRKGISLK